MKNKEELKAFLADLLPFATIEEGKQYPEVIVPLDKWHETAQKLRKNDNTPFDYLISLTAVDYLTKFRMVYHLESTSTHDLVVVKIDVENREKPQIDTISDIWVTAEFHEREVFDLFGIRFNNHPDLRRLFLEEGYGFPLRKDFKDEINIIELLN
jgi:NADH:ubiquinone oxidoreductase subunit C